MWNLKITALLENEDDARKRSAEDFIHTFNHRNAVPTHHYHSNFVLLRLAAWYVFCRYSTRISHSHV